MPRLYGVMNHLQHRRDANATCVNEHFRRALDGDEHATRALHTLAYAADDDQLSEIACRALRALGGPRTDGRRPLRAGHLDQSWVGAVVDQLLSHHGEAMSPPTLSARPIGG